MSSVNPLTKELLLKIVYYGPGLAGKTTSLQFLHRSAPAERRGKMVSLATPVDRTLYFELVPANLPKVGGNRVKLQLFTVPGQVHYNATRKLVLTGADGVVFVADSQRGRMEANAESLANLRDNLNDRQVDLDEFPLIFQYNKRDVANATDVETLEQRLNPRGRQHLETCAITGQGIQRGLELICKEVLASLERQDPSGRLTSRPPGANGEIPPPTALDAAIAARPTLEPPPREAPRQPAPEPAPDVDGVEPLSFAFLWPESEQERPRAIERAVGGAHRAEAARMIWQELERLLTRTGKEISWSSPAGMISLLGLDGRRFLGVARLAARAVDGEEITREQLLEAYLFLAQVAGVISD